MDLRFFYLAYRLEGNVLKRYLYSVDLEKVKLFGMGYVINHCISLFQKEQEEEQYNKFYFKSVSYIAQSIRAIANGLAQADVMPSYVDFINDEPEDNRTAEEIVDDVLAKCGLGG